MDIDEIQMNTQVTPIITVMSPQMNVITLCSSIRKLEHTEYSTSIPI